MKGTRNKNLYNRLPRHDGTNAGTVGPDGKAIAPKGPGFSTYATAGLGMLSTGLNAVKSNYTYTPKTTQSTIGGVGYQEEQVDNSKIQDNTLGNMASMAGAGAALGPWGAVAGAGLGLVTSLFGNSASERAQKKANEGIRNRNTFNRASAHTTGLQNDWNLNNTNQEMQYVAQGGVITNPNARVDEGEVMQEPNGNMETVENSNPNTQQVQANTTDGYVANLKEGTRILSNKIKMPGSKQTFAEAGQKIESKLNAMKKREPKSHIEANTARLNESNLQKQYNDLFTAQEAVKGLKMRPGVPKETPQMEQQEPMQEGQDQEQQGYATGGETGNMATTWNKMYQEASMGNPSAQRMISLNPDRYMYNGTERGWDGNRAGTAGMTGTHYMSSADNEAVPAIREGKNGLKFINGKKGLESSNESIKFKTPEEAQYFAEHYKDVAPMMLKGFKQGGTVSDGYQSVQYGNLPGYFKAGTYMNEVDDGLGMPIQYEKQVNKLNPEDFTNIPTFKQKDYTAYNNAIKPTVDNQSSTNYNDWANLAPSFMNIANSFDNTYKAQTITPESMVSDNPYEGQILNSLKRRRARFQPGLDQNNTNATIARYNSRQSGSGSRQQDVAIAAGKMRADQNVIDSTNETNNKYMTEYTNTLNQLGQQKASQMSAAKQYANTYNNQQLQQQYQSEEGRRNLLGTGLKGIADYYNTKNTDAQKEDLDNRTLDVDIAYAMSKDTGFAKNLQDIRDRRKLKQPSKK